MTAAEALIPSCVVVTALCATLPWLRTESATPRRAVLVAFIFLKFAYLAWRVGYTVPEVELTVVSVYCWGFLGLELLMVVPSVRFLASVLQTGDRSAEADLSDRWYLRDRDAPPMIDILIPTYNEPWEVIEKTVTGALAQDYPRFRVWVLDDGRRVWLRERVTALGAHYATRDSNQHAKSGNLNNGLARIATLRDLPEFVAVLDADFIPRTDFLRRTAALMHDQGTGLVQTPQYHFNLDPFQTKFRPRHGWPDTQRYMYDFYLPARDAVGEAFCCGTSFLVRYEALRAIGGFPTESITEDVLTTIKLRQLGWRTVFLREPLTTGLAPEGLREYLVQRGRWSLGSVQIALWFWSLKNIPIARRMLAFESMIRWGYTSAFRLLYLTVPLLYFYFDLPPLIATGWEVVAYTLPQILLLRMFMTWATRGTQLPVVADAAQLTAAVTVVRGMCKGLFQRGNHKFAVTDKGARHADVLVHWGTLRYFVVYSALVVGGVVRLALQPGGDLSFHYLSIGWSVYNLLCIFVAAAPCVERPRRRTEERYLTAEHATIEIDGVPGVISLVDVSVSGIAFRCARSLRVGRCVRLVLDGVGAIEAQVVRQDPTTAAWGACFVADDRTRHALIRKIFCSHRYVFPPAEGSTIEAMRAIGAVMMGDWRRRQVKSGRRDAPANVHPGAS